MTQLDAIQEWNVQIAELKQLLNKVRTLCSADDFAVATVPQDVQAERQSAGITVDASQNMTGNDVKLWMEQIQGRIDARNSTMQLNMIKLQSELNKQNQAAEMQSNQIKTRFSF